MIFIERHPVWAAILGVLGVVIVGILIWGFATGFQYATADVRGSVAQRELVRADGNFRVQAYDHFFDLCTSIQGDEARLKALKTQRDVPDNSPADVNRINATLPAIQATRDAKIAQYNNDAQKVGTIGPFRSAHLPEHLNINDEETTCAL
jgi:hypothetical protein